MLTEYSDVTKHKGSVDPTKEFFRSLRHTKNQNFHKLHVEQMET